MSEILTYPEGWKKFVDSIDWVPEEQREALAQAFLFQAVNW